MLSSVPLDFSNIAWIEIARWNSREFNPSMDVAKGKSQRESTVQNRRRIENKFR